MIDSRQQRHLFLTLIREKILKLMISLGVPWLSDRKLTKLFKNTKRKKAFLKKSRFSSEEFDEDNKNIIDHYVKIGFSDAEIVSDSIWRNEAGAG